MKHRFVSVFASLCALSVASGTASAQKPTETVGEKLQDAVKSIKRGANEAGESIQQQYDRARSAVHNMGVAGRVYGRLHWDKDLQGAKINLDVHQSGVATLTGTVPNTKAKIKAVALTLDTVGVVKVVDQTTILSADNSPGGTVTTTKETKEETRKP